MTKIKILLTFLGLMSGSALLFSFATPKNIDEDKGGQSVRFDPTKYGITTLISSNGVTRTFSGVDATGQTEGADYSCNTEQKAICTITGGVLVSHLGSTFIVRGGSVDSVGVYTPAP